MQMAIHHVTLDPTALGYAAVRVKTDRGEVACRYYGAPEATRGVIWVGGVGGGWDTPARELYPRLSAALTSEGIASLRVRFREPGELAESTLDVLAGVHVLHAQGITDVALVGHSFGGAVVMRAAAFEPSVSTVVTLATQSYGAVFAEDRPYALLLLHGTGDRVLPPVCSESIFEVAPEPKRLVLYPGAGHVLDEAADEVEAEVRAWLSLAPAV